MVHSQSQKLESGLVTEEQLGGREAGVGTQQVKPPLGTPISHVRVQVESSDAPTFYSTSFECILGGKR